ncbi:MAG: carbohydrate-binding domain-containing protein [Parasporobacterium sp.]|nr:carbohydrate-binding domain-containing protein [Parasporobacterium sp.]
MKHIFRIAAILVLAISLTSAAIGAPEENNRIYFEKAFTARDLKNTYDEENAVELKLNDTTAECSSSAVKVTGRNIVISDEGTYVISGTLSNGSIIVNAGKDDKVQLVLDNADISCQDSAAICILTADKVFLTLKEGTENSLSNGGFFIETEENTIDAVLMSKEDLTINGTGSLSITAPKKNAVTCKDTLRVTSGKLNITAEKHGFSVNDAIYITSAEISIKAGKDGLHCKKTGDPNTGCIYLQSGNISIDAADDAVSAMYYYVEDICKLNVINGEMNIGEKEE